MRNDIIVAGIILVIVGIIFYFIGNNTLEESRWYIFSSNYQNMRSSGNSMVMIGYIFGIVGFITSIAGIFAPTEEQMKKVIIGKSENNYICSTTGLEKSEGTQVEKEVVKNDGETKENVLEYCFQCGEKIEGTPKFCYKCGVRLR
jgi:hypothetical protein